jgi:hypothetical protein
MQDPGRAEAKPGDIIEDIQGNFSLLSAASKRLLDIKKKFEKEMVAFHDRHSLPSKG